MWSCSVVYRFLRKKRTRATPGRGIDSSDVAQTLRYFGLSDQVVPDPLVLPLVGDELQEADDGPDLGSFSTLDPPSGGLAVGQLGGDVQVEMGFASVAPEEELSGATSSAFLAQGAVADVGSVGDVEQLLEQGLVGGHLPGGVSSGHGHDHDAASEHVAVGEDRRHVLQRDTGCSSERGQVDDQGGLVLAGRGDLLDQHQAPFGVGVDDPDVLAEDAGVNHIAVAVGAAPQHVPHPDDAAPEVDLETELDSRQEEGEGGGRSRHVHVHLGGGGGGLQGLTTVVLGHALADQVDHGLGGRATPVLQHDSSCRHRAATVDGHGQVVSAGAEFGLVHPVHDDAPVEPFGRADGAIDELHGGDHRGVELDQGPSPVLPAGRHGPRVQSVQVISLPPNMTRLTVSRGPVPSGSLTMP